MVRLIAFFILAACLIVIYKSDWKGRLNRQRHQSPSKKKKATLFDVKALLQSGHRDAAERVYQEIFQVTEEDAKQAVDDMDRNLRP